MGDPVSWFNIAFWSFSIAGFFWLAYTPLIDHLRDQQTRAVRSQLMGCLKDLGASIAQNDFLEELNSHDIDCALKPDLVSVARVQRGELLGGLCAIALVLAATFIIAFGYLVGWTPREAATALTLLSLLTTIMSFIAIVVCLAFMAKDEAFGVIKSVAQYNKIKELLKRS